jgi:hypothetical protein
VKDGENSMNGVKNEEVKAEQDGQADR